jgi:hypothetical protein
VLAAAQARQAPRSLTLDQGLERFPDESRFLLQPGEFLSFSQLFIIESQGRSHSRLYLMRKYLSSFDADFNASTGGADIGAALRVEISK